MTDARTVRFFCDDHLRRLARWLRAAGHDVAWEARIDDRAMVRRCREEGRVLLTLDRRLSSRPDVEVVVLGSHDPEEQVREVVARFGLDLEARAFTRCTACNAPLEETQDATGVPPRVRATHDRFWRCAACGRTYWEGTHVARLRERFARLVGAPGEAR